MANEQRGHEIATIDVAMVGVIAQGGNEFVFKTASKCTAEVVVNTTEAVPLIIKGVLKAQKPKKDTITGHTIVLTDNVFNPQLVVLLQGGTVTYDATGKLTGYTPPVAGSEQKGEVLILNIYSAIYDAAGLITGYEKLSYPNCQGSPFAPSAEDNVFRVAEYTINSAPAVGEAPYAISYIDALPELPTGPTFGAPGGNEGA